LCIKESITKQVLKPVYLDLMFGPDAGHAGERSFRDFFRLPPTKENRRQSVDLACRLFGVVNVRRSPVSFSFDRAPLRNLELRHSLFCIR
jgi:hypothetical protein